jgi:arylsulfatase A-like enzyme
MPKLVPPFISVLFLLVSCQPAPETDKNITPPPNVVLILADDFGVGDIQAHYPGNKIATPYLDRLVAAGRTFTDAHSASAVCTPTRYGILTGRYAWRTPLQEWVLAAYEPPLIEEDRLTLPAFLQHRGYHTTLIGKWHLGMEYGGDRPAERLEEHWWLKEYPWDFTQPVPGGPVDRGFDYYFGVNLPNQPPFTYQENDRLVVQPTEAYRYDSTQGTVMPRHFEGSPIAPGWRFDSIVPELTERAIGYLEERAAADEPFFLFYSMTSPHEPVSPSGNFAGRSGINPIADFVMETDEAAGRVIAALDSLGLSENTLVIFTADNGHSHYTGWEGLVAAGHRPSGPYRGHKGDIWEGGHRVPLVVRWPAGGVGAGSTSDHPVVLNDLYATVADILDEQLPPDAAEDSFSFLPALTGSDPPPRPAGIVSHSRDGEFAYREGDWKLVLRKPVAKLNASRGRPAVAELYHLGRDEGETSDLTAEYPEKVAELRQQLYELVRAGGSREGVSTGNDVRVVVDTIQPVRYAR